MKKDITVITTIFNTPKNKLKNLKNYKKFKTLIFEQEAKNNSISELKKYLGFELEYFPSSKNIGLSKSSNFLFNKVKTKYCLFTQADVQISFQSILNLRNILNFNRKLICVCPSSYLNKKKNKNKIEYKNRIDLSCVLIDVKKMRKIGFFDEDFFLYWEDIYLMRKINNSNFKMAEAKNVFYKHDASHSTNNSNRILIIRSSNYIFGELVYDQKINKLRIIKVARKLIQNFFLFFFNIFKFQLKDSFKNYANFIGVLKFILYYFKKKLRL